MSPGGNTPKYTGTVPKIKSRNSSLPKEIGRNTPNTHFHNNSDNSLPLSWQSVSELGNHIFAHNNSHNKKTVYDYYDIRSAMAELNLSQKENVPQQLAQNSVMSLHESANSVLNQVNVPVHPVQVHNKQHLKQKLRQIREYLKITSSMINCVNGKEQIDSPGNTEIEEMLLLHTKLQDSEDKLVIQLRNLDLQDMEINNEKSNTQISSNERSQSSLSQQSSSSSNSRIEQLQQEQTFQYINEEKQRLEAQLRSAQETQNLFQAAVAEYKANGGPNVNTNVEPKINDGNCASTLTPEYFESTVSRLQEKLNQLRTDSIAQTTNDTEEINTSLQLVRNRLSRLQELSDGRSELAKVLDDRDELLSAEHRTLQEKLKDLYNKKQQVEKLVMDLQRFAAVPTEDKAVSGMRTQLATLHAMLESCQRTESELNNSSSGTSESNADNGQDSVNINWCVSKSDKNEDLGRNRNMYQPTENEINNEQENPVRNMKPNKKSNKNVPISGSKDRQQTLLKAELEAKKRQLENLMRKDQGQSSVMNQDNCSETSHNKAQTVRCCVRGGETFTTQWRASPIANIDCNICSSDDDQTPVNNSNISNHVNNVSRHSSPILNKTQEAVQQHDSNIHCNINDVSINGDIEQIPTFWRKLSQDGVSSASVHSGNARGAWNVPENPRAELNPANFPCDTSSLNDQNAGTGTKEWWQKKALHLQQQLEQTSNLYQTLIVEQQQNIAQCTPNLQTSSTYPVSRMLNTGFVPQPLLLPNTADVQCYNLVTTSQLHLQTMMLTSLNQCCQLLWMQQKEFNTLRNMVAALQENMINRDFSGAPPSNNPPQQQQQQSQQDYATNNYQKPSYSQSAQQHQQPIVDTSSIGYPMSPLNQPPPPHSHLIPVQNLGNGGVMENQNLAQQQLLNNATSFNNVYSAHNNMNEQQRYSTANGPIAYQVNWNRAQALNNQVPPGNRTNNYWDNFRSYSRQNLLSTSSKSNEGSTYSPSLPIDRSHNTLRTTSNTLPMMGEPVMQMGNQVSPKSNTNSTQEVVRTCKRRKSQPKPYINIQQQDPFGNSNVYSDFSSDSGIQRSVNSHPPSNLNLSSNISDKEDARINEMILPSCSSDDSKLCTKQIRHIINDRNQWSQSSQSESTERSKSTLFEMLRENVYKEVATLISTNENRPHFLIQLFRDLQLISSDRLRQRTLQFIQGIVSNSNAALCDSNQSIGLQTSSTLNNECSSSVNNDNVPTNSENKTKIPTENSSHHVVDYSLRDATLHSEIQSSLVSLFPILSLNEGNNFNDNILKSIKSCVLQMITSLKIFKENSDKLQDYLSFYQTRVNTALEESLAKYIGLRVYDITGDILTTVSDIVFHELTLNLCNNEIITDNVPNTPDTATTEHLHKSQQTSDDVKADGRPQMSNECTTTRVLKSSSSIDNNGDLAEADQSHSKDEVDDQEGAVGGLFEEGDSRNMNVGSSVRDAENLVSNTEVDSEWINFEPGLDCVPSRLNNFTLGENESDAMTQQRK